MHAEMTVGIDLCSLENLKIFNGHDVVKKESRRSIESSPEPKPADTDSDDQSESSSHRSSRKGRQKCGRPANPIPRHKRQSHIKAEYKRRDKIQKGFDSLICLVPELRDSNSSKESKSSMLCKAAEYCRRLKGESGNMQSETEALRQELEALGTQIHELQERLPQQGLEVTEQDTVKMDALYDGYVAEETKRNWKFWIFGFFMRPLYMSYRQAVSGANTRQEFSTSINDWIRDTLSLSNLRKGIFEALRKISIQTGIMTNPEGLAEEAEQTMAIHYVQEPQTLPKPEPPRSPKKTKSEVPTPIPSPVPIASPTTPSPALSRKQSFHKSSGIPRERESRKSKESRSRSATPPSEEQRSKRRTSHNRVDRRIEQEATHSGKRSRAASPRTRSRAASPRSLEKQYSQQFLLSSSPSNPSALFSYPAVQNHFVPIQRSPQAGISISPQAGIPRSPQADIPRSPQAVVPASPQAGIPISPQAGVPVSPQAGIPISPQAGVPISPQGGVPISPQGGVHASYQSGVREKDLIKALRSLLQGNHQPLVKPQPSPQPISSATSMEITPNFTSSSTMLTPNQNQTVMMSSFPVSEPMETQSLSAHVSIAGTLSTPSFLPIDQSGIITNSTLLTLDTESFDSPALPDLQSLITEDSMSAHTSMPMDYPSLSAVTTAQPTIMSVSDSSLISSTMGESMAIGSHYTQAPTSESMGLFNPDEDSLMNMLTVDVMDVNSVMNFFTEDQNKAS